jgi:YHS domain-containing protein
MRTFILSLLLVIAVNIQGQNPDADKRKKNYNVSSSGLALGGYDAVSYFSGTPKKGSKNLSYSTNGITYYFSSQANLDLFKKSPAIFEPAYGGWCAYAMGATGEKVEVDPETFKIVEGHLCLFYNAYFTNTLPKWNKDEKSLKPKADKNWMAVYK